MPSPKWKKGQSGNPNGRPKVAEDFRAKCRKAVDELAIKVWIEEVETRGENWPRALEMLAAYGYGKPTQPVDYRDKTKADNSREYRQAAAAAAAQDPRLAQFNADDPQGVSSGSPAARQAIGSGGLADSGQGSEATPPADPVTTIN